MIIAGSLLTLFVIVHLEFITVACIYHAKSNIA